MEAFLCRGSRVGRKDRTNRSRQKLLSPFEAAAELGSVIARLENGIGFGIGSANGTFIDRAERTAVGNELPLYSPKIALGESVGASIFWQLTAAAQALKTGMLPGR